MIGFGDLNLKLTFILAISVSTSSFHFMFSNVEYEKRFFTPGPEE